MGKLVVLSSALADVSVLVGLVARAAGRRTVVSSAPADVSILAELVAGAAGGRGVDVSMLMEPVAGATRSREVDVSTSVEPVARAAVRGREDVEGVTGVCCVDVGNSSRGLGRDCSWSLEAFLSSAFPCRLKRVWNHERSRRGIVALRKERLSCRSVAYLWESGRDPKFSTICGRM